MLSWYSQQTKSRNYVNTRGIPWTLLLRVFDTLVMAVQVARYRLMDLERRRFGAKASPANAFLETICSTNWSILVKLPNIMSFEESNSTSNIKPPKLVHSPCHAMILCKEIECPILPRQKTKKKYKNTTKRSSPCGHGVLGQCCVTKLRELE